MADELKVKHIAGGRASEGKEKHTNDIDNDVACRQGVEELLLSDMGWTLHVKNESNHGAFSNGNGNEG